MAKHNELGRLGETLAALYLVKRRFTILERNFHFHKNEIDIIATDEKKVLHFVEVKTLTGHEYPELAVTRKKFRQICKVADEYLFQNPVYTVIRFDILAININDNVPVYFFIEDVYL